MRIETSSSRQNRGAGRNEGLKRSNPKSRCGKEGTRSGGKRQRGDEGDPSSLVPSKSRERQERGMFDPSKSCRRYRGDEVDPLLLIEIEVQ
jgi:hypothetical protein